MSRRQSLDRPGILSPPGPFLTPSPSPSISASPRLQPSPSLSPFPQDVVLVAGGSQVNANSNPQEHERKAATPGRRQSIHQFTNGSPNAGTVVFQPSPSQSPAAATTVIGVTSGGLIATAAGGTGAGLTAGLGGGPGSSSGVGVGVALHGNAIGNELNATLVGSNNIQLNKKGTKRATQQQQQQQQLGHQIFSSAVAPTSISSATAVAAGGGGYGQFNATAISTPTSFATSAGSLVSSSGKGPAKGQKGQQQHHQQFQHYQSSSPLIADSPIPSPSGAIAAAAIKPPTPQPQPMQMLPQQFTISQQPQQQQQAQQVFQFIQGPQGQLIATTPQQQQPIQQQQQQQQQPQTLQQQQHRFVSNAGVTGLPTGKTGKAPQQILPKPQQELQQQKKGSTVAAGGAQISQSPQQTGQANNPTQQQQQQQILLPAATNQPQQLLLNQMPVLVQQNPQGVQLILRPPTPQLTTTPSLVIQQNARGQPQLQTQPAQQQLLRIVGTNGATMQLAAAPTFIVSSQANLIHQTAAGQFQSAIKSGTQLTGLHAALAQAQAQAQAPRSQPFATTATLNTQLLGQSVAAQLQNLQLAAAQIQMPNGLTAISQLPAHLQQSLGGATINLNQLNGAHLQQIANAFQTPQAPGTNNGGAGSTTAELFTQSSPAHVPLAVTPEPLRQPTPVPMMQQQQQAAMATIQLQQQQQQQQQAQIQQLQHQLQQTQSQVQQAQQSVVQATTTTVPEPKKKPRPRKKKQAPPPVAAPAVVPVEVRPTTPQKIAIAAATPTPPQVLRSKSPSPPPTTIQRSSNGKLDLGDVMKFCGITGDDDDDEDYGMGLDTTGLAPEAEPANQAQVTPSGAATAGSSGDIMISIPNQNGSDGLPFTLTIPAPQPQNSTASQQAGNESATEIPNILIKIDPSAEAAVPPFGLSTPRLPTAEEIQKQAQQHLAQQAAAAAAAAKATTPTINISLPSMTLQSQPAPIVTPTPAPTSNPVSTTAAVKPRRKPAVRRNAKKPEVNSSSSTMISSSSGTTTTISSSTSTILNNSQPTTVNTITLTTPTPVTSSSNPTLMLTHGTPTAVPSQIGNIQISQVHNHHQSAMPVSSAVENKIQIMPILPPGATVMGGTPGTAGAHTSASQSAQLVFQPTVPSVAPTISTESTGFKLSTDGRQMQLVAIPQATPPPTTASAAQPPVSTPALTAGGATILPPQLTGMPANVSVSVGSPASAAALVPQLTGSLTLTVSEQCERLILRHDPNNPQDHQSQLILQALLKGALPNVTIINEPTRVDPNKQPTPMLQPQQQVIQIPQPVAPPQPILQQTLPKVSAAPKIEVKVANNRKLSGQVAHPASSMLGMTSTTTTMSTMKPPANLPAKQNEVMSFPPLPLNSQVLIQQQQLIPAQLQPQLQPVTVPVTLPTQPATISVPIPSPAPPPQLANNGQQRYIALPPIDPTTQQLFCLNSVTNQITAMSAGQTAASIGPTERLLIAPAGINAQQLAQCLQLGQLHFNDVNPLPPQQQQQQQQVAVSGASSSMSLSMPLRPQPPQQQIVHPIQPITNGLAITTTASTTLTTTTSTTSLTTVTKQVANVAPIIDQSKAKLEPAKAATSGAAGGAVAKKKPVRKPKATPTNASELANLKNASVVKPMPKLDPLSQKPNNNPVQIVQPNVASGKQMIVVGSSSCTTTTTTTMSASIQPFQTTSGTKLVGVTVPMQQQQPTGTAAILQQQQQQRTSFSLTATTVATPAPMPSPTVASGVSQLQMQQLPPQQQQQQQQQLLSQQQQQLQAPKQQQQQPQPNTVSRVQTIQLTPQMQQIFKQVQMQIQFLTIKLQNKTTFLPVSPEIDPTTIAAYNKPMTDAEINLALQRLFAEQHRILASGKEVPTPEGMLPTANGSGGFSLMPQAVQQQQQPQLQPTVSEPLKTIVPANVVQPNNHSSTTASGAATGGVAPAPSAQQNITQRIHIYPMQHQQQAGNKQKPAQPKPQPEQQSQLQMKPKEPANRNKANSQQLQQNPQQLQQQQPPNGSINMLPQKVNMLPVVQQQQVQQQQHQQQPLLNKSGPPPLIFASSTNLLTNSNSSNTLASNSVMQVNNMLPLPPLQPQQQQPQQQQLQQQQQPTPILPPVAAAMAVGVTPGAMGNLVPTLPSIPSLPLYMPNKMDEMPTQKPKIARLSLFVRQLEVDQESCLKPDYVKPFRTKDEAVKRLIRYHCMHENDVELPSDEDEEFESTALGFQDKFRQLNGKFQEILMQESTLPHRTSEILQMQQLMIDDLKGEINDIRTAEKELEQQQKEEQNSDKTTQDNEAKVKEEIKQEPMDKSTQPDGVVDKFDLLKNSADVNKAFSKSQPQPSATVKQEENHESGEASVNGSVKSEAEDKEASKYIKKDYDNFDIESELTTSFIMKKVESKAALAKNTETRYQERSLMDQQQQQQHIKGTGGDPVDQEDGWYCLQKELNLMNSDPMQQPQQQLNGNQPHLPINRQTAQQPSHFLDNSNSNNMMNNSNHMSDLFPNGCIDKSNQSTTSSSNSSCVSDSQAVSNPVKTVSSCSGQREQPVVLDAEQQNEHPAISELFSSDSDVQKSVETRLEAMFGESPVHLDVKSSSDAHDIESNLDEIFGDSKSPAVNHKSKMSMWVPDATFMQQAPQQQESQQPQQYAGAQQPSQHQHHIELNCNNNPRWMQSMEAHYSDFLSSGTSNGELVNGGESRKRSWDSQLMGSGSDMEDDNSSKRLCTASSSSSSSPMSSQQQQHVQVPQHGLLDSDMLPAGFPQMLMEQQQQQVQQQHNFAYANIMDQQQHQQQHFQHNLQQQIQQQQQMHVSHMGGAAVGAGGEYDDDISRHVASAIDSILNLQNSGDSLQFSLGSILGDSMLDDQRQAGGNMPSCQQEQVIQRRRQLGEEMNDCLISGGGSAVSGVADNSSNILLEHHHQQHQMMQSHQQQPHLQHHHHQNMTQAQAQHLGQLNDFSCVAGGLDDPVKSIMTS
ncbi:hypothetical protein KR084_003004 [Drosophila pseudotakahashii]|nr:hypothetical protein KR084_003004 [Drosophila pseudotakahashii]